MSKDRIDVSDNTAISMPMRNLMSIVAAVAVGVWAYFGVLERITMLETKSTLAEKDLNQAIATIGADLEKNTEFRIKWPRGEMGSLPADSEQFMLIEHIAGQVEAIQKQMENMMKLKYPEVLWIVDAVSSMAGIKIDVDTLGIDFLISSTQKAWGLPAGFSVCAVSDRMIERSKSMDKKVYFFCGDGLTTYLESVRCREVLR